MHAAGTSCIADSASGPDLAAIRAQIETIMDDENTYNPSVDNAPGCLAGGGDIGPVHLLAQDQERNNKLLGCCRCLCVWPGTAPVLGTRCVHADHTILNQS